MRYLLIIIAFVATIVLFGCQTTTEERSVVVYTSVDQMYSEPVLKRFEEQTGIRVLPVFDVEAAKTTGLVNRLIAEKNRPQADVFWNGEFAQTILLKEEGVLSSYKSPNSSEIPDQYIDPEGYWTGFAGRARVLLVNKDLVSPGNYPVSIFDLLEPTWPADQIGIAYPLFGTTATHSAALYASLGPDEGRAFFQKLYDRGVRVVDGNSVVRDLVASGQLMMGLTDTDDACGAINKGAPVAIIFLDQNDLGTLIVPNTVALIAGSPHPDEAKELIDFLLNKDVAELLVESGWSQVPLRAVETRPSCPDNINIRGMSVSLLDIYEQLDLVKRELAEIYIR